VNNCQIFSSVTKNSLSTKGLCKTIKLTKTFSRRYKTKKRNEPCISSRFFTILPTLLLYKLKNLHWRNIYMDQTWTYTHQNL